MDHSDQQPFRNKTLLRNLLNGAALLLGLLVFSPSHADQVQAAPAICVNAGGDLIDNFTGPNYRSDPTGGNGGYYEYNDNVHFAPFPAGGFQQPVEDYVGNDGITTNPSDGAGDYLMLFRSSIVAGGEYCAFRFTSDGTNWTSVVAVFAPVAAPANIPVFGPIGLLSILLGLFLLGRRKP